MENIILLIVGLSLIMFTYTFLPVRRKNRKRAMLIGISLYLVFFALAVFYSNASATKTIGVTNIDITKDKAQVSQGVKEKEPLIRLVWEPDQRIILNQVFNLKLSVKNESDKAFEYVSLKFQKEPLTNYFSISTVKPSVSVSGDTIGLGGINANATKEFIFELVPKKSGLYSEDIVLVDNDRTIVIDGQEISSKLQLNIDANN